MLLTPLFRCTFGMVRAVDSGLIIGVPLGRSRITWKVGDHDLEFQRLQRWLLCTAMEYGFYLRLRSDHQLNVLSFITSITFTEEEDHCEWHILGKKSNKYSTGVIYKYLRGNGEVEDWTRAIWTSRSIPRQNFHGWLVALNRLPSRDRLISWGLQVPPL